MNRLIKRTIVTRVVRLKFEHWNRNLCSHEAAKVTSSSPSQTQLVKDQAEKRDFSSKVHKHDIAIVGGGMVGLAFACSLASMPLTKHLNVAIVDSNPALFNRVEIEKDASPDPRVSTVTPATISLFKDIGAWKYVEEHRHAYFDKMQVWDYTGLGFTTYNARDVNKDVLGCVIENRVLLGSLLSCIQTTGIQKIIYQSKLMTLHLNPSSMESYEQGHMVKLDLSDGNSICAKLVVGADGSKSRVRDLAGFETTGWSYPQNAIICTVEHDVENRCAWQRFLPSGPIALLPVGDNYSNIVWTMNPREAMDRKALPEDDFVKEVNYTLDYGFGPHPNSAAWESSGLFSWLKPNAATLSVDEGFEVPPRVAKLGSERMVFPLSLRHAKSYAVKNVALIGDAAHTVHPLAGQGVNMGFGDAFALARVIAEGIAVGIDIGEVSVLKKYESERMLENIAMMAVLDGIQKAYTVDFGPLNVLRAAAFHGANYISPLKKRIISFASGEQRLPLFA